MDILKIVLKQRVSEANELAEKAKGLHIPAEGWIKRAREILFMKGEQLGDRVGLSKSSISQYEKKELSGSIQLKVMKNIAAAMGCKFVYAFVPEKDFESIVQRQIDRAVQKQVKYINSQMALENQLPDNQAKARLEETIREQLLSDTTGIIWEVSKGVKH